MMKKQTIVATMTLGLAFTMPVWATQGDAEAGKEKAVTVCAACHSKDGNSTAPNFPKLAGQNEDYLKISLLRYRSKERINAIMNGQAAPLTDKEIADLAAYFASQKGLQVKY
jgi:cytochrome c553